MESTGFSKRIFAFLLILLVIMLISCQRFLPEAYQEEEFAASALDAKACKYLNDSLSVIISTFPLTNFDSTWVDSVIYENVGEILDSLEAHQIMVTDADTSYSIITPMTADTNYVYFFTELSEVVFFFDDFVDMNIIGGDGTIFHAKSRAIPLETVFDCPKVKARFVYDLLENRSLIQIIKTDQTMGHTFRLVILPGH